MKKFFSRVLAIIAIILIIIAIIWSAGLLSPALTAALSSYFSIIGVTVVTAGQLALIGALVMGLAMVIDSDEAMDVLSSAFDKVSKVAETVTEAATDIVSNVFSATGLGNVFKYAAIGLAGFFGYKLIKGDNNGSN